MTSQIHSEFNWPLVDVTHLFYISEIANFCIQFPAIDELNDLIQSLRWNEFWTCQNGLNWGDNTTMNIQILTLKIGQSNFTKSIHENNKLSIIKGYLIAKCLVSIINSFKKRMKKSKLTTYYGIYLKST